MGLEPVGLGCVDSWRVVRRSVAPRWGPASGPPLLLRPLLSLSVRYASKKHWSAITRQMKQIYTAPTVAAAESQFAQFAETWRDVYPAMIGSWEAAWDDFVPFLAFPVELRKVVYTTNAIESLNARYRRTVKARGHFPTEQAGLKCLYLVTRSLDPTGRGKARWAMRWKPALNAFAITFGDRFPAAETY